LISIPGGVAIDKQRESCTYVFIDRGCVDGSSQYVEDLGQVLEVVAEHQGRVLLNDDGEVVVGDPGLHLILSHGQVGQEDRQQLVELFNKQDPDE
jgi:hypothetical protein